jgi:dipeptidyl aminopeptidase/acylaminoacyl peptidase
MTCSVSSCSPARRLRPDGEQVVFVYKWIDTEKNKYFSNLWRVRIGEEAQPFTYGEWSDSQPRWSPDGKQIAFVSSRQKPKTQIYVIPADGGEARPITNLEEGSIGSFRVVARRHADCLHLSRDRP